MTRPARSSLDAVLADPGVAEALAGGAALFVAATGPARIIYASGPLQTLFGTTSAGTLGERLLQGGAPGQRRLAQLMGALAPGAAPRLERLRFIQGLRTENLTFMLRRMPGTLVVGIATGARIAAPSRGFPPALIDGLRESVLPASPPEHPEQGMAPPPLPVPSMVASSMPVPSVPALPPVEAGQPQRLRDAAAVSADLAARFHNLPFVRFLWQTDAGDRLTAITGQLCDVVGCAANTLEGRPFVDLVQACGPEAADRLQHALARRETWSGLELLWPVSASRAGVPVVLGGVPAYDVQKKFEGFRGFGVVHLHRVVEAGIHEPLLIAADARPEIPAAIQPVVEAATTPDLPVSNNVVTFRPSRAPAQVAPASTEPAPPPSETVPPPPSLPVDTSRIVELSVAERTAFREIARALGAKVAEDTGLAGPIKGKGDAARPEKTEPPAAAPRGLRIRDLIDLANQPAGEAQRPRPLPIPTEVLAQKPEPAPEPAPETISAAGPANGQAATVHSDFARAVETAAAEGDGVNLRLVLDRLPVGIVVSRMDVPIFVNRTLLDLLGHADADSFHAAGGLEATFLARPDEVTGDQGIASIRTVEGELIPVDVRLQAIDWDGQPATLTTFRRPEAELAPRVRTLESDLRQRDLEVRELHTILDTATDGVVVLDEAGTIVSLNRSAEALFGYEQNDVVGEPFTALLARDSHPAALEYLARLKSSGVASVLNDGRDVVGRARQGGSIPMFMTFGRIATGSDRRFCAVLRDMTQWKKAERELNEAKRDAERSSALKSDFLAKVSHEVRTPLNAIMGFSEVIMEERFGPIGNERYKDYLKDIHASGAHVMSLVNDLLDLSKIEAGKLDLTFESVDANRIVSECVSLMQPQANRERVIVRMSLAPRLPNIVADERSLRQIVLNLLSNGVKFNEPGGQVIVSTALTDAGHAVIRIRDTGIGMSDPELQTALEPFRQVATARRQGGTGLGLPLTKALVEANRASFTIKSRKSEGTLVEVAFPPTRVLAE